MKRLRLVMVAGVFCAALCLFCIAFVDRPVAQFCYAHQSYRIVFQAMAAPSLLSLPLALVYLTGYAISAPFTWPPGVMAQRCLGLCAAVLAATALKDELKWWFGRPWPEYWVKYGFYTFSPLADGPYFGCFPSGHTAYIAAPMFLLCWVTPRYKAVWLGLVGIVMIGLVAAGYHYVGDVVAGLFVGLAAAGGTMALMPKEGGAGG